MALPTTEMVRTNRIVFFAELSVLSRRVILLGAVVVEEYVVGGSVVKSLVRPPFVEVAQVVGNPLPASGTVSYACR